MFWNFVDHVSACSNHGWDMQQMDVKGVYLNGWLKEEIYMKQPAGFDDEFAN